MTAPREWAYLVARAFVIDEQQLTSGPNGITIEPLSRGGFIAWGGGFRIQFGSGIGGHDNRAAVVRVGDGYGPQILGPYVQTKKGLVEQLKKCRGVVCRTCKGWSRGDGTVACKTCFGFGVYLDDDTRKQAQKAYDSLKRRSG